MGGMRSRRKGAVGEREVAALFREIVGEALVYRTPRSGGGVEKGDLSGDTLGLHVEVKRAERLMLPAWTAQAEGDCPEDKIPVVFYRSNGQPWRVSMQAAHFLELLKEARCPSNL